MMVAFFGYHLSLTRAFTILVDVDNNPLTAVFSPAVMVNRCFLPQGIPRSTTPTILHSSKKDDVIDVEFEFQAPENTSIGTDNEQKKSYNNNVDAIDDTTPKSLLDAAYQMGDPALSSIPFEFIDSESTTRRYIECKIAFVVEKDGITYSIGTPCDTQVAVLFEGDMTPKASTTAQESQMQYFIDPDEDENLELFEKAAAAFKEEYGDTCEAVFKRTPRTLTIEGDLDSITGDWRRQGIMDQNQEEGDISEKILKDFSRIDDDADSDEFFDNFFKEKLGEGYREEVLGPNEEADKKAKEMMDLFSIPGVGTQKDDDKGIDEMLGDIFNGEDLAKANKMEEDGENQLVETGLRLLGFTGPDGKAYSLVKLIEPMVIVAKEDPELGPDQKMLLTVEESNIVVPRLEDEFKKEFGDLNKD